MQDTATSYFANNAGTSIYYTNACNDPEYDDIAYKLEYDQSTLYTDTV